MARARSVLDRMLKAMNRGESVRTNFYANFKMRDIDVFAKPKRKTGTPAKKQSTTKTFRKADPMIFLLESHMFSTQTLMVIIVILSSPRNVVRNSTFSLVF
jgi:hypothetical protein